MAGVEKPGHESGGAEGFGGERHPCPEQPDAGLIAAVERRLARLRYDLHDGPQQDVHLLALDLGLFREQLLPSIAADANRDRLVGRLDDLEGQLAALDAALRRLSTSVESPFLDAGPLPDALAGLAESFAGRTGIRPQIRLEGDFSGLGASGRITVLAVIREALSNVRKHGGAATVTIAVSSDASGVTAAVIDDGRGFEADSMLEQAEREGHLGLVGMRDRVRMLGGETKIESRPGGPTSVSVVLPPWPPPRGR